MPQHSTEPPVATPFDRWEFAAVPAKELPKVTDFFGLYYQRVRRQIVHSMSTSVISPQGTIYKWYDDNTGSPPILLQDANAIAAAEIIGATRVPAAPRAFPRHSKSEACRGRLVFAIEDKVGDGEQRAAVLGIGQFFETSLRAVSHIRAPGFGAIERARFAHKLVICSGCTLTESALLQNLRDELPAFACA